MKGYYTNPIIPQSADDAKGLSELADGNNIYIVVYYENEERIEQIAARAGKEVWLKLKNANY